MTPLFYIDRLLYMSLLKQGKAWDGVIHSASAEFRMTTTQTSSLSENHRSASSPGLKIGLQLYFCSVWQFVTVHTTTNTWLHCSRSVRFTFRLWVSLNKPMSLSQQWVMHQQSDILISSCCVFEAFNFVEHWESGLFFFFLPERAIMI